MTEYKPLAEIQLPKFAGIKTFMRLPHLQPAEGIDFAVVGIPWDGGTSYRTGQRMGPDAIRRMSGTLRPFNPGLDVAIFDHCRGVDWGDLTVVPGYTEESYARIEAGLEPLVQSGAIPVALGGDHAISLPELRALARLHGPLALVHFDSHTDTAEQYFGQPYYHGSMFRRAVEEQLLNVEHSVQVGMHGSMHARNSWDESRSLGFDVIDLDRLHTMGLPAAGDRIRQRVGGQKVFVTFDIDVVDPAFAPGTGTPEVGGLSSAQALEMVRGLKGLNFAGFDLVEVLPSCDAAEITALLAANIVYEFLSLIALNRRQALSS